MKILIVGSGGREHALAWQLARSPQVDTVLVAPGNAGTAGEAKTRNVPIAATDGDALVRLVRDAAVDFTVIGPEAPLVAGLADRLQAAGHACLGPMAAGARLEGSKGFAKTFLARHRIPTAASATVTDLAAADDYIAAHPGPLVVKADGLAAGKGVVMAADSAAAHDAAASMLTGALGDAGRTVVLEEWLQGVEVSYVVLTDGDTYVPLASAEDHKRRDDGDRGPNTGGMGAFSPASAITPAIEAAIGATIIAPTLRALRAEGIVYRGFLYAGLMITATGPRVLEFNCRCGDPETQPVMMRLKSDLVPLLTAAAHGQLRTAAAPQWDPRPALCVVLAAGGYPGSYEDGQPITGLGVDGPADKIFHAGTRVVPGGTVTGGGRVLCVTAIADDLPQARALAYRRAAAIRFHGVQYRRDIGDRRADKR